MANGRTEQLNAFVTNLTNGVAGIDTEITVDGAPTILPPYYLTLDPLNPEREFVLVTAAAGNVLTVTRGLAGTGSQTHVAGDPVIISPSAQHFTDIWDVLDGLAGTIDHGDLTGVTANQHHTRYTGAEAITATDGVYLNLSGGILTGPIDLSGNDITNVGDIPGYVTDAEVGEIANSYLALAGGTMLGFLFLHSDPTEPLHATPKQYVDNLVEASIPASLFGYVLDPTITDADPGPGLLRRNNATPAATTFLYIDNVSSAGVLVDDELKGGKAGSVVYIQNYGATSVEAYHMTGDAIDGVGYVKLPVELDQSTGTIVAGDDILIKTFAGGVADDFYLRLDGLNSPNTDIPWGDQGITSMRDGVNPTDAATVGNVTSEVGTHASDVSAHHTRYADSEALESMGVESIGNPYNHVRYTDAEALSATADHFVQTSAPSSPSLGTVWVNPDDDPEGLYLPLTGGTVTGAVTVQGILTVESEIEAGDGISIHANQHINFVNGETNYIHVEESGDQNMVWVHKGVIRQAFTIASTWFRDSSNVTRLELHTSGLNLFGDVSSANRINAHDGVTLAGGDLTFGAHKIKSMFSMGESTGNADLLFDGSIAPGHASTSPPGLGGMLTVRNAVSRAFQIHASKNSGAISARGVIDNGPEWTVDWWRSTGATALNQDTLISRLETVAPPTVTAFAPIVDDLTGLPYVEKTMDMALIIEHLLDRIEALETP